jgi:hypothetical protein
MGGAGQGSVHHQEATQIGNHQLKEKIYAQQLL